MNRKDNVTFFSPNRFDKLAKAAATKAEQNDIQRFFNQTNRITKAQRNFTSSPTLFPREALPKTQGFGGDQRSFRRVRQEAAPVIDITPVTPR